MYASRQARQNALYGPKPKRPKRISEDQFVLAKLREIHDELPENDRKGFLATCGATSVEDMARKLGYKG
jgi:hypothetical protein